MTPEQEDQLKQEYEKAPEGDFMDAKEFHNLYMGPPEDILSLSKSKRSAFFSTCKYHAGQRQAVHMEGIVVGKRKAEDILAERRKLKAPQAE